MRVFIKNAALAIIMTLPFICCGAASSLEDDDSWVFRAEEVASIYEDSAIAYFRYYDEWPDSVAELEKSEWMWIEPIAPENMPNFEIVDRPLSTYQNDFDKIHFSFTDEGYSISFYPMPKTEADMPGLKKFLDDEFKSENEWSIENDEKFSIESIRDLYPTKSVLARMILMDLTRSYLNKFDRLPKSWEDLLDGNWKFREEVKDFLYSQGDSVGVVYHCGLVIEDGDYLQVCETVMQNEIMETTFIEFRVKEINGTKEYFTQSKIIDPYQEYDLNYTKFIDTSKDGWELF